MHEPSAIIGSSLIFSISSTAPMNMGSELREDVGLLEAVMDSGGLELGFAVGAKRKSEMVSQNVLLQNSDSLSFFRQELEQEGGGSASAPSCNRSGTSVLDPQMRSILEDAGPLPTLRSFAAPICRQFWKAGNCNGGAGAKVSVRSGQNHLHVHPRFLHSNATSHKWVFGAIAELLDNALDEIQNGATYVMVDRTLNPRDGSVALLIQDNGGGMGPEALRWCLSFGFSDKESGIGKYGNGFKTSTMRLGADVIVFTRHVKDRSGSKVNSLRVVTQTISLLSYTFLTRMGYDRIVVPTVDYEFNPSTGMQQVFRSASKEHFLSNLSILLHWSPYSSEADLLMQFNDVGSHGTKVIIYNLWYDNDGMPELDFNSNPKDIFVSRDMDKKSESEQHIAHQFPYSLRAYLSILYLRIPESFNIVLRGQVVKHHNIADDLKFIEYILYRPHTGGCIEDRQLVTTIGFLKEAPAINVHGFNVYHKNRLILPFWQVVTYTRSRGRGVVGILEVNHIEPIHNKQDFERTPCFQKLEARLKQMTIEYWDLHNLLIGYKPTIRKPGTALTPIDLFQLEEPFMHSEDNPVSGLENEASSDVAVSADNPGCIWKQKDSDIPKRFGAKRRAREVNSISDGNMHHRIHIQPVNLPGGNQLEDEGAAAAANLIQQQKKLRAKCLEYEKSEKELTEKLSLLMIELEDARRKYAQLQTESQLLDQIRELRVPIC